MRHLVGHAHKRPKILECFCIYMFRYEKRQSTIRFLSFRVFEPKRIGVKIFGEGVLGGFCLGKTGRDLRE